MIDALIRKVRQVAADPVLRRWLAARLIGRVAGEPPFTPHRPPYLTDLPPLVTETPSASFVELPGDAPVGPIDLPLPGRRLHIEPGDAQTPFERTFDDTETLLALHRFAWLPLLGDHADPAWVNALWQAWRHRFGTPSEGWAWHPYTAAERAVNILDFARRQGLPGPRDHTLSVLAAHGPAIAERLEYFGDHHTSNHLANDGRGLYLLGLALGLERCADLGARILLEEARRIFSPSGILREGSSHYHLLLTRSYVSAWLAARAHGRPEAASLEYEARKTLAAVPALVLPGGMPLMGDVSPDCPPGFLMGLAGGDPERGWTALLDDDARHALNTLRESSQPTVATDLVADGWLRADFGPWSGLWHAAPGGWSHMPGHGHQDCGGFEVHHADQPLFRDPGRGTYGEDGEAALYRSAETHNTLTLDGANPYPPNKPYYDEAFRRRIGGPPPVLDSGDGRVTLTHHGFARLPGGGPVHRAWTFSPSGFHLVDRVEGSGRHRIVRRLLTTLPVELLPDGAIVRGNKDTFRLTADTPLASRAATCWQAYGEGIPATVIEAAVEADLPWEGRLTVEVA